LVKVVCITFINFVLNLVEVQDHNKPKFVAQPIKVLKLTQRPMFPNPAWGVRTARAVPAAGRSVLLVILSSESTSPIDYLLRGRTADFPRSE